MPNSLTRKAGLRLGPIVLETLVKHYFDRIKKDNVRDGKIAAQLRQDELLYDEAFNIVKVSHSVEEVQAFSNNRTPSPPWVHVVRLVVPMSCCDDAAVYLIQALGGEDVAKRVVGGTKWWQVRGVRGIDGEWITAKKDWQDAKKRWKAQEKRRESSFTNSPPTDPEEAPEDGPSSSNSTDVYDEEMDEMRCILYAHGGGYYFGSLDQERYSIQRHARKINGRVFAINYRLAPQYPFPCALQDLLASYLYLIRPPPDASHRPVKPAHIVVAGDSAGGGLTLALLQVLRDTGLPMPAGGILISPWCDMTHSFPSIHTNTATDVLPPYGLSMQKPSPLWPPPSDEWTHRVHARLRHRIRQMVHLDQKSDKDFDTQSRCSQSKDWKTGSKFSLNYSGETPGPGEMPVDVGATASLPPVDSKEQQTIRLTTKEGEVLTIDQQVHLYTQNSLMGHPLVSPALSYLGGLPPLFFIASEKEVLRDEIIYAAHKAANPSRFPVSEATRALYPPLDGIEEHMKPTPVHLQVYDDTAHVLPVLFAFTTPGKFCYRAIATFTKHVTGMTPPSKSTSLSLSTSANTSRTELSSPTKEASTSTSSKGFLARAFSTPDLASKAQDQDGPEGSSGQTTPTRSKASLRRSLSRAASTFRGSPARPPLPDLPVKVPSAVPSGESSDVGGPRVHRSVSTSAEKLSRTAGEASVYHNAQGLPSWKEGMIRERVSTRGVIRPLEPESELDAFHVPPEIIGVLSELAVRRYIEGKAKFDKKFAKDIHAIEKHRSRNLELAKKDVHKNMANLQGSLNGKEQTGESSTRKGIKEGLEAASGSWFWAWALDMDERPPPSSIVSRRDTDEARRLAQIADQAVLQEDGQMTANNLWAVMVNFLTVTPDKAQKQSGCDSAQTLSSSLVKQNAEN
ncbi:alpha/beta-hydrolase [Leucogyrophana mollusca]|uniref:Alpha/beta-hydrolase n=1 Tax=Leucogyrophana mollusca TaxID=85980 RepID=A0ACB8BRX5_9AGAM|nr:alpha/beta-hydrolase [Leucogyrophana mollusca]